MLLIGDHHEELVHSLIGDLALEALYFAYDLGHISNSPYRKDQTLTRKKVLALLRSCGFSSFGFELKSILLPLIVHNASFSLPSALVY